jgi:hypothetical protein
MFKFTTLILVVVLLFAGYVAAVPNAHALVLDSNGDVLVPDNSDDAEVTTTYSNDETVTTTSDNDDDEDDDFIARTNDDDEDDTSSDDDSSLTPGAPNTGSSGTNFTGSMTYTGQLYTRNGTPVNAATITEGTYYTASGDPIYYMNGWYYYPIATVYTNGSSASVTPGAPNTGSSGSVNGTVLTPGAPNTGMGGFSGVAWFVLVVSALSAMGGLAYVMRRVTHAS